VALEGSCGVALEGISGIASSSNITEGPIVAVGGSSEEYA